MPVELRAAIQTSEISKVALAHSAQIVLPEGVVGFFFSNLLKEDGTAVSLSVSFIFAPVAPKDYFLFAAFLST